MIRTLALALGLMTLGGTAELQAQTFLTKQAASSPRRARAE
jgi:hypothetical protein